MDLFVYDRMVIGKPIITNYHLELCDDLNNNHKGQQIKIRLECI